MSWLPTKIVLVDPLKPINELKKEENGWIILYLYNTFEVTQLLGWVSFVYHQS